MNEHPLREQLHNEIHARPYERLTTPGLISQQAFLCNSEQQKQALQHLRTLLAEQNRPQPADGCNFHVANFHGLRLRWERHGEFISYTWFREGLDADPACWFASCANASIPTDWKEAIPGQLLAANHVALLPEKNGEWQQPEITGLLNADALVGATISDDEARVWTDLRIQQDGYTRFVLQSRTMTPRRRGRQVQRLLEIETYRMLALLSLPAARLITPEISALELRLSQVMNAIRDNDMDASADRTTLHNLSELAAMIEGMVAEHHSRFTASSAYHDLVLRRISDLHEQQFQGLQTLGQFMDRRLTPAMQTCFHALRRLHGLSERVSRCSNLLQTRVEVEVQQQNRELLASMNSRQYLQLRLQQTVEGLSVAAITYYASSLVGHLAEAAYPWSHMEANLVQGVSIPILGVMVWLGLRRAHQSLQEQSDQQIKRHRESRRGNKH